MAQKYKTKQVKFDLKFNEKALRGLTEAQRDWFVKKGSNYLYIKKVWLSIGPDKDYTRKTDFDGLKVVFQFGKGKDKFAHITIHNLSKKGAKKVNRHGLKDWFVKDQVLVGRAKKWAKRLGFTLEDG